MSPSSRTWAMADMGGGGGINTVAVSPLNSLYVFAGGDVSGFHISKDGGVSWANANRGMAEYGGPTSGSTWSPTNINWVWCLTTKGLAVSTNIGVNWTVVNATIQAGAGGGARPRTVGHTIHDDGAGHLYAVLINGDLWRWDYDLTTPSTGTATKIATLAGVGHGLFLDPADSTVLYVAHSTGVLRLTNIQTGAATSVLFSGTAAPASCLELAAVTEGGVSVIYSACGNTGILRALGASTANTWTNISAASGGASAARNWTSIDAVRTGSTTLVLISAGSPLVVSSKQQSCWYTADGSVATPTWICVTNDDANFVLQQADGGVGNPSNWQYSNDIDGTYDKTNPVASNPAVYGTPIYEQCQIDRANPNKLWMGGQAGTAYALITQQQLWSSYYKQGTLASLTCYADPVDPTRAYVTNVDHAVFGSKSGVWRKNRKGISNGDAGPICREINGPTLRLFLGDYSGTTGQTYFTDDIVDTFHTWTQVGTTPSGARALALAVRRIGGASIAIGFFEGVGFAKATFSSATPPAVTSNWAVTTAGVAASTSDYNSMWWASDTIAYCFAKTLGVYITRDAGASWSKIWNITDDDPGEGFVSVDPSIPGTCYVSVGSAGTSGARGLWRLTGCEVAAATVENSQITKTSLAKGSGAFSDAGPLTTDGGIGLAVIDHVAGAQELYVYDTPRAAIPTGTKVSDITYESLAGIKTRTLSVSADGAIIYVLSQGPSLVIGTTTAMGGPTGGVGRLVPSKRGRLRAPGRIRQPFAVRSDQGVSRLGGLYHLRGTSGVAEVRVIAVLHGRAVVSGLGTVSAFGLGTGFGHVDMLGQGTVTAIGRRTVHGHAAVAGTGTVTAIGVRHARGHAAVAGAGSVTALGIGTNFGRGAIAGVGSVTAIGFRHALGHAAVLGQGTITAIGLIEGHNRASIFGQGAISASGIRTVHGHAAVLGQGLISADGVRRVSGHANVTGAGLIGASGLWHALGHADIVGEGTLIVFGAQAIFGHADISGTGTITARGRVVVKGTGEVGPTRARVLVGASHSRADLEGDFDG